MKELSIHYIYNIYGARYFAVKMMERLRFGFVKFFIKIRSGGVPHICSD